MEIRKKNKLSEEEYMFLSEFIGDFSADAKEFFDIVKNKFGDDHPCTKFAAIAINYMQYLKVPIKDQCEIDMGSLKSHELFKNVTNFMTDGYYTGVFR